MNHLLSTLDISENRNNFQEAVYPIESKIIQIAISSDLLFIKEENIETAEILTKLKKNNTYYEIKSIYGHDGFLLEYQKLRKIFKPIFDIKRNCL